MIESCKARGYHHKSQLLNKTRDLTYDFPLYTGSKEFKKRSFISMVRPPSTLIRHENAALFLRLRLRISTISTVRATVHTKPYRKRSFISTVKPIVHSNPSRKRSFISAVRPTVHTNPSRKRRFSETLLKP